MKCYKTYFSFTHSDINIKDDDEYFVYYRCGFIPEQSSDGDEENSVTVSKVFSLAGKTDFVSLKKRANVC